MLAASCAANVITMLSVLYIAFGGPKVHVDNGYVRILGSVSIDESPPRETQVRVRGSIDINDRVPVRVEIVR